MIQHKPIGEHIVPLPLDCDLMMSRRLNELAMVSHTLLRTLHGTTQASIEIPASDDDTAKIFSPACSLAFFNANLLAESDQWKIAVNLPKHRINRQRPVMNYAAYRLPARNWSNAIEIDDLRANYFVPVDETKHERLRKPARSQNLAALILDSLIAGISSLAKAPELRASFYVE